MILVSAYLSQYTRVTNRQTTDDDRQHLIGIAEVAMQLQRSAKITTQSRKSLSKLCTSVRFLFAHTPYIITYNIIIQIPRYFRGGIRPCLLAPVRAFRLLV